MQTASAQVRESDSMDIDAEPPLTLPFSSEKDSLEEDEEYEEDERIPPARFRPVFLDQKQWYQRDYRIERLWKDAEKFMKA